MKNKLLELKKKRTGFLQSKETKQNIHPEKVLPKLYSKKKKPNRYLVIFCQYLTGNQGDL